MKKGQTTAILIVSIIIIGLIIFLFVYNAYYKPNITGNVVYGDDDLLTTKLKSEANCRYVDVPYKRIETTYEREPYTEKECIEVLIKYTFVENLGYDSQCLENTCVRYKDECRQKNFWGNCVEFEQVCIEQKCSKKKAFAQFKIKNIDDTGGTFSFDLVFIENEKESRPITASNYVRADGESTFRWDYPMEKVDSQILVKYGNQNIPIKTVCENVIKYRNVPITKEVVDIKQEYQCN